MFWWLIKTEDAEFNEIFDQGLINNFLFEAEKTCYYELQSFSAWFKHCKKNIHF